MSREISLVNDYDGVFKDRVEVRELRVEVQPAALSTESIRGFAAKVAAHKLGSAALLIHASGSAAVGIPMTLHP
jgi:hypothetical protein